MDRLKQFLLLLLAVIGLYIFSTVIINVYMHPDKIGGTIYNLTHKQEVTNEIK